MTQYATIAKKILALRIKHLGLANANIIIIKYSRYILDKNHRLRYCESNKNRFYIKKKRIYLYQL